MNTPDLVGQQIARSVQTEAQAWEALERPSPTRSLLTTLFAVIAGALPGFFLAASADPLAKTVLALAACSGFAGSILALREIHLLQRKVAALTTLLRQRQP